MSRMAPRPFLGSALVALALLSGCGGEARDATSKELSALTAEISKLRAEQASMSERLSTLERSKTAPPSAVISETKPQTGPEPVATRPLDGDRPSLDVVKLGPPVADEGDGDTDEDGPRTVLRSGSNGIVVEEAGSSAAGARTVVSDPKKTTKKSDKLSKKPSATKQ